MNHVVDIKQQNKLICLVGMGGSGKSEVSEYLRQKHSFGYVRFGQIVMDKVKESGQPPSEKLEREIRERIREEHGMAAMAVLNFTRFKELLEQGDVIGDGLYSWEEYLFLKDKFDDQLIVVAVYAPPKVRYDRLENRDKRHQGDKELRFRSFKKGESFERDKAETGNLNKGGPIAMADYILINNSTKEELFSQVDKLLTELSV